MRDACQSKDILNNDAFSKEIDLQLQMIDNNIKADVPVNYFDDGDFSYFTKVERLEDRFSFCDISEEMAKTMTTDAIVRSVLHYPLNYLIFAYNNPINAVKLVLDNSHLHQELLLREDAAETILHYFEKTDIDMNGAYPSLDESYRNMTYAEKVFYVSGDHSAIPLSSTLYISKWGAGPLMEHAPAECPYNSTNMQYFWQRSLPYNITLHIVGDRLIAVNSSHNYSLPHYYNNMSVSWSAEPFPGISGNCHVTVNLDGSCSFSADTPGAYYIYFEGYRNGELIITANYDVVEAYGI